MAAKAQAASVAGCDRQKAVERFRFNSHLQISLNFAFFATHVHPAFTNPSQRSWHWQTSASLKDRVEIYCHSRWEGSRCGRGRGAGGVVEAWGSRRGRGRVRVERFLPPRDPLLKRGPRGAGIATPSPAFRSLLCQTVRVDSVSIWAPGGLQ
eukprot:COSAG02_NODE_1844_length_10683_cov_622.961357_11_plen_152_part_00